VERTREPVGRDLRCPTEGNDGVGENSTLKASAVPRLKPSPRQKLVVFTEHRDTLSYLETRVTTLLGRAEAVVVIHGAWVAKNA
jgi:hypothetical protein